MLDSILDSGWSGTLVLTAIAFGLLAYNVFALMHGTVIPILLGTAAVTILIAPIPIVKEWYENRPIVAPKSLIDVDRFAELCAFPMPFSMCTRCGSVVNAIKCGSCRASAGEIMEIRNEDDLLLVTSALS